MHPAANKQQLHPSTFSVSFASLGLWKRLMLVVSPRIKRRLTNTSGQTAAVWESKALSFQGLVSLFVEFSEYSRILEIKVYYQILVVLNTNWRSNCYWSGHLIEITSDVELQLVFTKQQSVAHVHTFLSRNDVALNAVSAAQC